MITLSGRTSETILAKNSESIERAKAFVDTAVNTLLPRLKKMEDPRHLEDDQHVLELLRIMLSEVRVDPHSLNQRQIALMVVVLPEIMHELKRLKYPKYAEVCEKIQTFFVAITSILDGKSIESNRANIKNQLDPKKGIDAVQSMAEHYTKGLLQQLDGVLAELGECGSYDRLSGQNRQNLLWAISGGEKEVIQCRPEMIASVADRLSRIKAALEKDGSESYVCKVLIKEPLQVFLDRLKR